MPERFLGRTLGKYPVETLLGAGAFAWVFRARDPDLNVPVALKVLRPQFAGDPDFVDRFRREASTAARLRHPNVITIYAVGREGDAVYIAMDYLPQGLAGRLATMQVLPGPMLVRLGIDVARALAFAHREGIIHRDIKPDNVLFDEHGNAVVADFGIARAIAGHAAETGSQMVVGTPHYFAPEQARGKPLDGRADLYSLGATLYRAAAGVLPFPGDDWFEVARQHVEQEPVSLRRHNPAISVELAAVIHRCLEKSPNDRYPSAEALASALALCPEHGQESTTTRTVAVPALDRIWTASGITARRRRIRKRAMWGTALAGGTLLGSLLFSGSFGPGSGEAAAAAESGVPSGPAPVTVSIPALYVMAQADTPVIAAPAPRATGRLTLLAPADASLFLNDRPVGRGAWRGSDLLPGRYQVAAAMPAPDGCPTARVARSVNVVADRVETVQLSPKPCGQLLLDVRLDGKVIAEDQDATFLITGEGVRRSGSLPVSTPLLLPVGNYALRIERPACAVFSGNLEVTGGDQPQRAPVRLLPCERVPRGF